MGMSFCRPESHRHDLAGPALLFWIRHHHPFWFFCPKPLEAEDHFEPLDWDSLLIETIYAPMGYARKYLAIPFHSIRINYSIRIHSTFVTQDPSTGNWLTSSAGGQGFCWIKSQRQHECFIPADKDVPTSNTHTHTRTNKRGARAYIIHAASAASRGVLSCQRGRGFSPEPIIRAKFFHRLISPGQCR